MKKIYFLIGFLLITISLAAQNKYDGQWWNGDFFFRCKDATNNKLVFHGGNLHEGGYGFTIKKTNNNTFERTTAKDGDWNGYSYDGQKFEFKNINGRSYLFIKTSGNKLYDLLENLTRETNLSEEIAQQMTKLLLDGNYKTLSGDATISINAKTMTIDDGNKKEKFYIPDGGYEVPTTSYILCSKTHGYKYSRPAYGELILTPVKIKLTEYDTLEADDEGSVTPDGKPIHLKRINNKDVDGCYPILSKEIVLPGYLEYLSIEELNTARNEIFARHGYKFSNPKLEKIFKATTWYKCKNDNAAIKLSEVEQINVDLLILIENQKKTRGY